MSDSIHLLRLLIREEMEYYDKHMGRGQKGLSYGSSSSGVIEIEHLAAELQTVEGQIQQLEVTPLRMIGPDDTRKLDILKDKKAEIENAIKALQGIL